MTRSPARTAALVIALLAVLAGCDLPGGSSPALGPDRVPNDSRQQAQVVQAPITLRGTLGPLDHDDWYEIAAPSTPKFIFQSCVSGAVKLTLIVDRPVDADSKLVQQCDETAPNGVQSTGVEPGDRVFVHYERAEGRPVSSYELFLEYRDTQD